MRVLLVAIGLSITAGLNAENRVPRAEFPDRVHDFGAVRRGERIVHAFLVKNTGSGNLIFEKAAISDRALVVKLPRLVRAGEERSVTLELTTDQVRGAITAAAVVYSNDPERPKITLGLHGWVKWPVDVLPSPVVFLSAYQGETAERKLTLVNNGAAPLRIEGIESKSREFEVKIGTVEEGARYELLVRVGPDAAAGRSSDFLKILTNNKDMPQVTVPVHILVKNSVHLSEDRIDFGTLDLARLKNSPAALPHLARTIFVSSRQGKDFEVEVGSVPAFLSVEKTHRPGSPVHELRVGLVPEKLSKGSLRDKICVHTNNKEFPELTISVEAEVR